MFGKFYKNTAEYIDKAILNRPDGFPVWMSVEDCRLVYRLLDEAAQQTDDKHLHSLYKRFGTQWQVKVMTGHAIYDGVENGKKVDPSATD